MKLIKQKHRGDCGVACLAMMTGAAYEFIEEQIRVILKRSTPIDGMSNSELAVILYHHGFRPMQLFTLAPDCPAIVSVPSLGTKKRFHYVYFDGKKIYDPSNHETYSTMDFIKGFPLSDSVACEWRLNTELPSHAYNHFDWIYINRHVLKR